MRDDRETAEVLTLVKHSFAVETHEELKEYRVVYFYEERGRTSRTTITPAMIRELVELMDKNEAEGYAPMEGEKSDDGVSSHRCKCGYVVKDGDIEKYDSLCPECGRDWWVKGLDR